MSSYTNDAQKGKHQMMIELFMRGARQDIPVRPTMPNLAVRKLRARLMLEECLETINAGLGLSVDLHDGRLGMNDLKIEAVQFSEANGGDLIQVADGCADVEVVTVGTASACGIAHAPCFELVSGNNLMKFAPGHSFREDGKLIKPSNHPNIESELCAELIRQGMPPNLPRGMTLRR